jgi:hypothetical protein
LDQPAHFEQAIELQERGVVAQLAKLELLVGQRCLVAVVEAEGGEVADDAPRAVGQRGEVVPALLDGGAAVEPVAVEIGAGGLELDDGQRAKWPPVAPMPLVVADVVKACACRINSLIRPSALWLRDPPEADFAAGSRSRAAVANCRRNSWEFRYGANSATPS